MINSHLLYQLSYRGTTYFNLQLCNSLQLSLTSPHLYVGVSEAGHFTTFQTLVNPYFSLEDNDLALLAGFSVWAKLPLRVTYCGAHLTSVFLTDQHPKKKKASQCEAFLKSLVPRLTKRRFRRLSRSLSR